MFVIFLHYSIHFPDYCFNEIVEGDVRIQGWRTGQCGLFRTPERWVSKGMDDRACEAVRSLARLFISAVRKKMVPPQGFSEDRTGLSACHFSTVVRIVTGKHCYEITVELSFR